MIAFKTTRSVVLAASLVLPSWGANLMAQEVGDETATVQSIMVAPQPGAGKEQPRFTSSIGAGYAYQADADVNNSGHFSVNRLGILGRAQYLVSSEVKLNAGVGYSYAAYDFAGNKGFNGLNPWSDVSTLSIRGTASWQIDDVWTVYGGPLMSFAAERGASWSEGFTGGGGAGFLYMFNDKLVAGLGIAVVSEIADRPSMFPMLRLNWRFADNWELRNTQTSAGAEGGGSGLEVVWKFDPKWEASLGGQFRTSRFILDQGGVGTDRSFPIVAGVGYQVHEQVNLGLFAGLNCAGSLQVDRPDGTRIKRQSYDPAPLLGLRGAVHF